MNTNNDINTKPATKTVFAMLCATETRSLRRPLVVQLPLDYSQDVEALSGIQLIEWANLEPTSSSFELDDAYDFEVASEFDVLDCCDEDAVPDLVLVRGNDGRLIAEPYTDD